MTLRACGLALVVLLAAAGCGGGSSRKKTERAAAITYLRQVDLVQAKLRPRIVKASKAYRHFSTKPGALEREQLQFAQAASSFDTLERRLRRVPAPPVVAPLRSGLLRLVGAETSLARELASFATFLPRFRAALAPLGPANVQLGRELAAIKAPQARSVPRSQLKAERAAYAKAVAATAVQQATTVSAYATKVNAIDRDLTAMQPPAMLAPTYRAQVSTLAHVSAAGEALAAALQDGAYTKVAALDQSFRAAALGTTTLAVQRAERAAIQAYDAQVHRVAALSSHVAVERQRLQKQLG